MIDPFWIEDGELEHLSKQDAFRCGTEVGQFIEILRRHSWGPIPFDMTFNNDNWDRMVNIIRATGIPYYTTASAKEDWVTFHFFQFQPETNDDDPKLPHP